jgi:hypothetical protein
MKKAFIIGGSLIPVVLILGLITLRVVGFEPRDRSAGLWVKGELVTTPITDWTFTEQVDEIFVETRTWYFVPHSVNTYCTTYDGELYLFSAYYQGGEFPYGRLWNQNVLRDPRVRLKIGNQLFDRTVSFITDAGVKEAVLQNFIAKYSDWTSPGIDNVHIFRVLPG